MSVLHLILLIFGILLVIGGAVTLYRRAWIAGAVEVVIGLILLAYGGFISA